MVNYHALDAISRGRLNDAHHSWNLYFLRHVGRVQREAREPTAAIVKGLASHVALLQPEKLGQFAIITPAVLSKTGRRQGTAWRAFTERTLREGRTPILQQQAEAVSLIHFRVMERIGHLFLSEKHFELPIAWQSPFGWLKAMPDFVYRDSEGRLCIIDLKVMTAISDRAFESSSREWGYWLQDVHYCEGVAQHFGEPVFDFLFVCVESELPHRVTLRRFTDSMRQRAADRRFYLLDQIATRMKTMDWSEDGEDDIREVEHRL